MVDSAFYRVFLDDRHSRAIPAGAASGHQTPGAAVHVEFERHNVNGVHFEGLPADNFERVLPSSGWRIDYLGTTTYQANISPETLASMSQVSRRGDIADRMKPLKDQLRVIAPLLENHRVQHAVLGCSSDPPRLRF